MRKLEMSILALAGSVTAIGTVLSIKAPEFYITSYVPEDGAVEWLTVVALLFSAALLLTRAWKLRGQRPRVFLAAQCFGALILCGGAGEEISWGQRLIGLETPEWIEESNRQGEMNFHNLEVAGVNLNKLIFGKFLGVALLTHLLVIPYWYRRKPRFAALVDRLGIPLAKAHYVALWIGVFVLTELVVGTGKRGELREFALTFVLAAQLVGGTLNEQIYSRRVEKEATDQSPDIPEPTGVFKTKPRRTRQRPRRRAA